MNIAEILKNCPKGTKLYSLIYGELELISVNENRLTYPIACSGIQQSGEVRIREFTKDGKMIFTDAEPTLFPSKTQRDWNKFGVTDQETKPQLKPFDKVLVRDNNYGKWECDIFNHIDDGIYNCFRSCWYQCIPYEGNEHLLGTNKKPNNNGK